jgi:hypothetical protein
MRDFISSVNIPPTLTRAVIRQFGGWESFKQVAIDVTEHGIDSGFSDFIYTSDTAAFFRRNREAIINQAKDHADEYGTTALEMIAGFSCFARDFDVDDIAAVLYGNKHPYFDQIANGLAWYAAEEVCQAYRSFING